MVLDKASMILMSRSNAPASDFPNSNYTTTSAHDGVVLISSQISNRQIFKFPLFVNSSTISFEGQWIKYICIRAVFMLNRVQVLSSFSCGFLLFLQFKIIRAFLQSDMMTISLMIMLNNDDVDNNSIKMSSMHSDTLRKLVRTWEIIFSLRKYSPKKS